MNLNLTDEQIKLLIKTGDKQILADLDKYLHQPLYSFEPRPDCPTEYDQQTSFVFDDFDGVKVCQAGTGSGKTECCAYRVARFLLETPPPRKNTPFIVVSQDFNMVGSIWTEKLSRYITEEYIHDRHWRNTKLEQPKCVVLKPDAAGHNWLIDFRSYEQGREQFQAISAGGFWLDELAPFDILMEIFARCRDYNFPNSKFYTFTPLEPEPEIEALSNRQHDEGVKEYWRFYRMNTSKNTALNRKWYDAFFGSLPDDLKETRMLGTFGSYKGAVFKEINDHVHVIEPFALPEGCTFYRAVDYGFRTAACLWLARSTDGTWYVTSEFQLSDEMEFREDGKTHTQQFAERIKVIPWDNKNPAYRQTFADWANPTAISDFGRLYGIHCTPARKDVHPGIEAVRRKLVGIEGKPKLFIFSNCTQLLTQMKKYRFKRTPSNPFNPVAASDDVIKVDDHLVDCLRYAIFSSEGEVTKAWSGVTVKPKQHAFFKR